MSPELFEKLKNIQGYKYEICVSSNGFTAKLKPDDENWSMVKKGKSMDDLAIWILEETTCDREA